MGRHQREKGKRGEREAAAEIARLFKVDARRGRQYSGMDDAPDILTGVHGVHFEVKRTETLSVYKAMEQAVSDAAEKIPVVLHRRDRKDWLAVIRLEDLPRLAVQAYLTLVADGGLSDETID